MCRCSWHGEIKNSLFGFYFFPEKKEFYIIIFWEKTNIKILAPLIQWSLNPWSWWSMMHFFLTMITIIIKTLNLHSRNLNLNSRYAIYQLKPWFEFKYQHLRTKPLNDKGLWKCFCTNTNNGSWFQWSKVSYTISFSFPFYFLK